jgi:hypothetical protein
MGRGHVFFSPHMTRQRGEQGIGGIGTIGDRSDAPYGPYAGLPCGPHNRLSN